MMNYQFISEIIKNALNISDFNVSETQSGFSKQVYKITSKAGNFILYVWSRPYDNKLTENLTRRAEYLFPDGFTYFVHNTKLLTDIGIRVPYIITYGHHDDGDFDYAVVEYFEGQDLYEYMNNGGNIGNIADRITAVMDKMALNKRSFYGPPIEKEPNNISPAQLVYDFTAEELNIASGFDKEVSDLQPKILQLMKQKKDRIGEAPNQEFCLIHGELTPNHIFILDDGEIGLIDVDGIKYFDVEFDWAVINLAYGDAIPLPKSINTDKFEFYKLCWKIEYISVAADYLTNVDSNDRWFINTRESNLRDIKKMIKEVGYYEDAMNN